MRCKCLDDKFNISRFIDKISIWFKGHLFMRPLQYLFFISQQFSDKSPHVHDKHIWFTSKGGNIRSWCNTQTTGNETWKHNSTHHEIVDVAVAMAWYNDWMSSRLDAQRFGWGSFHRRLSFSVLVSSTAWSLDKPRHRSISTTIREVRHEPS